MGSAQHNLKFTVKIYVLDIQLDFFPNHISLLLAIHPFFPKLRATGPLLIVIAIIDYYYTYRDRYHFCLEP